MLIAELAPSNRGSIVDRMKQIDPQLLHTQAEFGLGLLKDLELE